MIGIMGEIRGQPEGLADGMGVRKRPDPQGLAGEMKMVRSRPDPQGLGLAGGMKMVRRRPDQEGLAGGMASISFFSGSMVSLYFIIKYSC